MPLSEVDDKRTRAMSKWRPTNSKALKTDMIAVAAKVGGVITSSMGERFGLMFDGWSHGSMRFVGVFALYIVDGHLKRILLSLSPLDDGSQYSDAHITILSNVLTVYNKTTINDLMSQLRHSNNTAGLFKLTPLRAKKRNPTRWSSTYDMLQRYAELRAHAWLIEDVEDTLPSSNDHEKLIEDLRKMESVCNRLQCEATNILHLVDYFDGADEVWKHLPVEEAPPIKRQTSEPTPSPATSPSKTPVKPSKKAPTKSPANAFAKPPAKSPATSPVSAHRTLESVNISTGKDRMDSGDDDDDYRVEVDEEESDVEATRKAEETSDEEDACDLSAGTPFNKMTKEQVSDQARTGWTTYYEDTSASLELPPAELAHAAATPTELAQALGNSLEVLFFLFLPKPMWLAIATESNRYQLQYCTQAADEIMTRQRYIKKRRPEYKMKTLQQVAKEQQIFKSSKSQGLVTFIGALCARTLCPFREKMAKHWAMDAQGAVPKESFGRYMSRKRFEEIVWFLRFSDNYGPDAHKYKTWKIKPIADTINTTFKLRMTVGQRVVFREAMIPMRSKYNPML
ncbi:Heat shock protein70 [Phytophthora megakarya]|uniref:Heat shock protein70 n=1 Tax=Phytophthora megakarya TaxID=4795 RepID=A0A225WPG9_9STRA|nr:Heat shock protein70 [Phytophthora megakarya]